MTDGVFTIPLIADIPLEDFEPHCAPAAVPGRVLVAAHAAGANGSNGAARALAAPLNGARHNGTFIAGPENRLLAEAVDSLLHASPSSYNPLLLCGPPGSGKSHIARGLVQHWRDQDRDALYASGADFARAFANALDNDTIAGWRARQRDTSLFVIEDINQLSGKRAAINELFHTIDAVERQAGQVVLTSRLPPERISAMPAALASRLVGGLVVHLAPPASAARLAIVGRFAEARGIALPQTAARLLADGLPVTPPELFGAVTELAIECAVDGQAIGPDEVRLFLASRRGVVRPSLRSIAALSAKYFGLKVADLTSPTRRRAVVQARNIAVYLARQLAGKSLEQLGRYFGGRDHTTILHGYRMIEQRSRIDPEVRQALAELKKMLAHG